MKNKEKNKINKKILIIIGIIIVLILIILFLIFGRNSSYTITFDTNGGTNIASIEVKNNEIVKLPDSPTKEGYTFAGWTNEEGKIITKGTKLTEDITLKAEWISNDAKTITANFDTDGGNEIDNIVIEEGKIIMLPVNPTKEGYTFLYWVLEDGSFITENMIVSSDINLKAIWLKNGAKTSTITFDSDGGSNVGSIIVENGKVIFLPVNPTKEGYKFVGWVDENGNAITKDLIVDKNITIKATWIEAYTCPTGCTPIGDGSTCSKVTTANIIKAGSCPSGTETIDKFCSSHIKDEDNGIFCKDNPTGYCVAYSSRYTIYGDSCPSGYFKYTQRESLGALYGCVKKYSKTTSDSCPSGYTKDGSTCKKTQTLKCKAN